MNKKSLVILAITIIIIFLIIIFVIVKNKKRKNALKRLEELDNDFNRIRSISLETLLIRSKQMVKSDENLLNELNEYEPVIEEFIKLRDEISEDLYKLDEYIQDRKYHSFNTSIIDVKNKISICQEKSNQISVFLDKYIRKEDEVRNYSTELKENFRLLKTYIKDNLNALSIAIPGLKNKIKECEDLFTSSNDKIFARNWPDAIADLDSISSAISFMKYNIKHIPDFNVEISGNIPTLIEKLDNQYTRLVHKGLFLSHLNYEEKINQISKVLEKAKTILKNGEIQFVEDSIYTIKEHINILNEKIDAEKNASDHIKEYYQDLETNVQDIKKLRDHISNIYSTKNDKYNLKNFDVLLSHISDNIKVYDNKLKLLQEDFIKPLKPATTLEFDLKQLYEETLDDLDTLKSKQEYIDKYNVDELKALNLITKLQVMINEALGKCKEKNINDSLSSQFKLDLVKSREYISKIKEELSKTPIIIEDINTISKEAKDFIHIFYNKIKELITYVDMAENAIIMGNKYRSSNEEVDAQLNKAEYLFLRGKYNDSIKISFNCLNKMFKSLSQEDFIPDEKV